MSNVPGVRDKPVRGYQRRQRAGVYSVNYVGWTAGKATTIQSSARKAPRDHALGVSLRRRHGIPLAPITRRSPLRPILSWNEVRNERIHSPSNIDVLIDSSTVPLSKGQPSSLMTQSSNHNSNIWIHEYPSISLQEKKKEDKRCEEFSSGETTPSKLESKYVKHGVALSFPSRSRAVSRKLDERAICKNKKKTKKVILNDRGVTAAAESFR